jgi:hypothetical protein
MAGAYSRFLTGLFLTGLGAAGGIGVSRSLKQRSNRGVLLG